MQLYDPKSGCWACFDETMFEAEYDWAKAHPNAYPASPMKVYDDATKSCCTLAAGETAQGTVYLAFKPGVAVVTPMNRPKVAP